MFAGIEKAEVLSTGESEDDHQAKECLQEGENSQRKYCLNLFDKRMLVRR